MARNNLRYKKHILKVSCSSVADYVFHFRKETLWHGTLKIMKLLSLFPKISLRKYTLKQNLKQKLVNQPF